MRVFKDFASIDNAEYGPMSEPVLWRQDAAPHRRGAFGAVVLRGQANTQSAGIRGGELFADAWTVNVGLANAFAADIRVGDTIERQGAVRETLTVQSITRDEGGWWIVCTNAERSPL